MSLTLECVCSPDASICTLTQLVYKVNAHVFGRGTIGALNILTLHAGSSYSTLVNPSGLYAIDLPIASVLANWGSLAVTLSVDASLYQVPSPPYSEYYGFDATYSIVHHYRCTNLITGASTTSEVEAHTVDLGPTVKCQTGENDIRGLVSGGIGSIFYKSTPLGDCFSGGISTTDFTFQPAPAEGMINIGDSSQICLCATGGSGSYTYSIVSGELPCGITLNQATGCLDGEATGDCPGTTNITFRVTDSGGGGQSSTGGVTIGGTCRAFGSGATRISGGAWTDDMAGNPITIGGNIYTVATVTPPGLLTVTGTIGIIDPTDWIYTSPVVPPPPAGPPEIAEVTCGFIATCPTSDTGLGGNSAY